MKVKEFFKTLFRLCFLVEIILLVSCKNQTIQAHAGGPGEFEEEDFNFPESTTEDTPKAEKALGRGAASISIMSWNCQTFFDAVFDGCEYSDFQDKGNWNAEKYSARLGRLTSVIKSLNPDIFVLEELENQAVVQDIANSLAGTSWKKEGQWTDCCFAKTKGSAIGCAVFSKFPLSEVKCHSLDIQCQKESQPSSRPLLQATCNIEGRELIIFVNHWKSKSGGQEATEIWRDWQEAVLGFQIAKTMRKRPGAGIITCGDFNRDIKDFIASKTTLGKVCFRYISFEEEILGSPSLDEETEVAPQATDFTRDTLPPLPAKSVAVSSPWFNSLGELSPDSGSYFYDGQWEKIDHFFAAGLATIESFRPEAQSPWADLDGLPIAYKIWSGQGYSDHLPIFCRLEL